ncbi:MAG: hypothetical protein QNJ55_14915 [Xenococcus sp. MO_188.B8]|nr:hypothetical protein [Xenococcus sp. MO_188.B8]
MSGIYKSRLFNFLNRQKIRFNNQLGIAFRHLQLATETGVQILLYPVYVIARTSISVRQQLKSPAVSASEFELTAESDSQSAAANASREKRSNLDDLWLEDENNNLASDLSKTDSLSTLAVSEKANSGLSLPRQDNSHNSQTTAPIGFFQKMLNWVKTSPVATKLNLFGEGNSFSSSGVKSLTNTSSRSLNSSLSGNEIVSQSAKNSLRSNISTTKSSGQESITIQVLIRRAIAYFFGHKQQLLSEKKQEVLSSAQASESATIQLSQANYSQLEKSRFSLVHNIKSWLEKVKLIFSRSPGLITESSEQESITIQILIRRAIAYFFGHKQQLLSGKKQEVLPSAQASEPATIQLSQIDFPLINSPQSNSPMLHLGERLSSKEDSLGWETRLGSHRLSPLEDIRLSVARGRGSSGRAAPGSKELKSSLFSQVNSWLNKAKLNNSSSDSLTTIPSAEDSLNLKILLQRAIAYFLGNKHIKVANDLKGLSWSGLPFSSLSLPGEAKTLSYTLPLNTWNLKLPGVNVTDFCLPENYLIQEHSLSIIEPELPELAPISHTWSELLYPDNFSAGTIQDVSCLVVTTNFPPTSTTPQESLVVHHNLKDSLVANIPLEFSSDLWEAEVITVGYVKNLLERILEFLDQITWWIEKQLLKLWQFFKQIFQRGKN